MKAMEKKLNINKKVNEIFDLANDLRKKVKAYNKKHRCNMTGIVYVRGERCEVRIFNWED